MKLNQSVHNYFVGVIDKEGTILIRTEAPVAGITGLAKTVDFQKCILKGLQN